jgi:hypothetical protein
MRDLRDLALSKTATNVTAALGAGEEIGAGSPVDALSAP